jgi:hypothetical protein
MKRLAIWIFYVIGALAICYLALYGYLTIAVLMGRIIRLYRGPFRTSRHRKNRREMLTPVSSVEPQLNPSRLGPGGQIRLPPAA